MRRLKEHLHMYGASDLSTSELIALLVSPDSTQALAVVTQLLETYGLHALKQWNEQALVDAGFTPSQAHMFTILCSVAPRFAFPDLRETQRICSVDDAAQVLRPFLGGLDHEEFRVLALDAKSQVVANLLLYKGTVDSCLLRAAEIYRPAIVRNCPRILVVHVHPSGDPEPSPADCAITLQLVEAGKLLDIELLDHLILGRRGCCSLKDLLRW